MAQTRPGLVPVLEIPFPHRTVYAGSVSDPFPVRVVEPAVENEGFKTSPDV